MKNQLKKINLHYAALQSLYWLGYATIWASRSVALAEKGCSNTLVGIISAVSLTSAALVFQPFMSAIADRSKSFTSRRFAMMLSVLAAIAALVNWLPGCTLLCSVIMYVVIGICMIGLAPFLNSMAMALVNKGVPVKKIEELIDEYVGYVHMEEYLDRSPQALSGGQQQSVAYASVLAMEPEVYV